jgi:urea carboxylase
MIFEQPQFSPGGDRYVLAVFGDEMNLELNFIAQGLAKALGEARIAGVIESAPCFASLLVHYEPQLISYKDLVVELTSLVASLGSSENLELPSRLFNIPVMYLDPWCESCVADYRARIADKLPDPELIVRDNGLTDVDHLVRVHSSSEYWVASLGFWPGLPFLMALDPRARLTAPKYNPPRTNTPQGAIGLGGAANSIYPVATPGGYQIFGRTPVPIWDATGINPDFEGDLCLFRPGDRIRFVPVTREQFDHVEAEVAEGRYVTNVIGYQKFIVSEYNAWIGKVGGRSA